MNYDVYNFKDFNVEIDGMTITAITEDGLSWENAEANGEAKIGALGDVIWQVRNQNVYTLTVTVLANCPQLPSLIKLFKTTDPFPVNATNKKLGLCLSGTMALFEEEPSFEFGIEAGDVELKLCVFDGSIASIQANQDNKDKQDK